ncbi:MAG: alanine--tRNA ligase [Flavobacteriales bacterium]|nr:alanine--tRNA ligase [Flavobacteriales bacterium]MCB9203504.1 alanine--tRNA ligase [Flavobacteriales bacterium]
MTSQQIRQKFLDFFESKQHRIVPSAPMVVKDDPTLMFTNAGMNQFKDIFLGNRPAKDLRVADTQKCLRVSGKHNDLEEVGVDTYHHTMFEMLGNWSFGDYFKKEAIEWAWELLVDVYGLDPDRLYATVFEGDAADNLEADTEAEELWKKFLPSERVLRASKKDNFWEMGDQGPCGPCSEVHIDLRSDEERSKTNGRDLVNADHPQVVEIWNLVFIQFNRKADSSLENLPDKHVDTGMGFERLCMALQGKTSNYDTDVFSPMIAKLEELSGTEYGRSNLSEDIAIRVVSDHIRAVAFSIADGQLPSNTGAGYVIRRILRRGIRYGYSFLGFNQPFIHNLVPTLVDQMGDSFPELKSQKDLITNVIKEEESAFLRTLDKGIERFNSYVSGLKSKTVDGTFAFELYDTFGFPIDLTELLAREKELKVDIQGFEAGLQAQKDRSRAATATESSDWTVLKKDDREEFVGYDLLETDVFITRYRKVSTKGKEFYHLVFNITPFYAESGGQVGDTGYIEANDQKTFIFDTKKENDLIIHFAKELPENPEAVFKAVVNAEKRQATKLNHTGTHLLHAVLRDVLGEHVEQKGSLVSPEHLRFDFSHFSKVSDEELALIENRINAKIRENIQLDEQRNVPLGKAKEMGAMALFGEKYGDVVRVITFDPSFSVELCGGTHASATGDIGLMKITSESSVAAGIRRIEALTGQAALDAVNESYNQVSLLKQTLKTKDPLASIEQLQTKVKELDRKIESLNAKAALGLKSELLAKAEQRDDYRLIREKVSLDDSNAIKNLCFDLKKETGLVALLGAVVNGNPSLHLVISQDLVDSKGWNAGEMIRDLAKHINGGGGGQPTYATAGGSKSDGLSEALSGEFLQE